MPGVGCDETDRDAVGRVGADVQIAHEQFLGVEVPDNVLMQPLEMGRLERLIHLPPPDVIGAAGLVHQKLVAGASARVRARDGAEGATLGDHAFTTSYGVFVGLGRRQVPVHGALRRQARDLEPGPPPPPSRLCGTGGSHGARGRLRTLHLGSHALVLYGRDGCRRRCSCASTAAMTAMLTMSLTPDPRCNRGTGCANPTRIGPMARAPPNRSSRSQAMVAAPRLVEI